MPGEYVMTRHELPDVSYSSIIDIFWCLRTWAYAVGMAGNFEVDSKKAPGTKVLMMPLHVALDYADRALRLASSSDNLQGTMAQHEHTRGTHTHSQVSTDYDSHT